MTKKTLMLFDGHNLFIRSFSGLMRHGLSAPDGTTTWGAFGAFNVVASLVRKYSPTHMMIAFDQGRSAKRLAIDPEYKANRHKKRADKPASPMDQAFANDFKPQFELFLELCRKSGIPYLRIENVEADDIIATAALNFAPVFDQVVIVSADHDLHQLIRPNIIVVKPSISYRDIEEEIYTVDSIVDQWGVEPRRLPEIWALMGDKGDNVKGIPGIGPKKATKLIAEHGTLDAVLNLDEPRIAENIDVVHKAMKLIELGIDDSIPHPPLGSLQFNPITPGSNTIHVNELSDLFKRLGFTQIRDHWLKNTLWHDAPKFGRSLR